MERFKTDVNSLVGMPQRRDPGDSSDIEEQLECPGAEGDPEKA